MRILTVNFKKIAYSFFLFLFCTYLTWHLLNFFTKTIYFNSMMIIEKVNISWSNFLNFKTVFLSIIIEALPFILIGVLVSAFLQNFVSEEAISKFLPRNRILNILLACFIGVIFPVCECGIVPVARRLVSKGVPLYSAITFMLAAPIINPVVASSTAVAFSGNHQMVWSRLELAFFVSFIAGLLISCLYDQSALRAGMLQNHCDCGCSHNHHHSGAAFLNKLISAFPIACDEFFDMGKYLIMGAALAAIAQIFLSRDILLHIGQDSLSSIAAMMSFAFGVSVCSSADAFIAASFSANFTAGSLLAFMVFGPMIDVKNLLMLLHAFRARFVVLLVSIVVLLVLAGTYLINYVTFLE
ncbi:putative permease [Pelotomaculum sp. FP]|nr:putative permease [Pelotomaculum sp. FP]